VSTGPDAGGAAVQEPPVPRPDTAAAGSTDAARATDAAGSTGAAGSAGAARPAGPMGQPADPELHELLELRELAVALAAEAGRLALALRREGVAVAGTKSSRTDVVTRADLAVESLVRDRLAAARPADVILGEEGGGAVGGAAAGVTEWVLDPIDGTVNYLYDIPTWAVSVAVRRDGRTLAAAVANPPTGEVFAAAAGLGATLTDAGGSRPLRLDPAAAPSELATALVGTGFGYTAPARAADGLVAARLLPQVRDLRRIGVASLDLCAVAAGRLDAYYERGLHDWDHAGGALVAAEAGAVLLGRGGRPVGADLVLAAVPEVAGQLLDALELLWADPATARPDLSPPRH